MGNSERISPSMGCPIARCASGIAIASGVRSLKLTQRQGGKIEMEDHDIRAALDRHWAASDANDFEAEHQIYREDAVLEYPQSGERIRGRRNIQASRFAQPSRKRFTVRRILGAADLCIADAGSHPTRRWRGVDSKFQFRATRSALSQSPRSISATQIA